MSHHSQFPLVVNTLWQIATLCIFELSNPIIFDSINPFKANNLFILRLIHQLSSIVSFDYSDSFIHSLNSFFILGCILKCLWLIREECCSYLATFIVL